MPLSFIIREPSVVPFTLEVPFSIFTASDQSQALATTSVGPGQIPTIARVMDVIVHKEIAFDTNTVQFGHGSSAGLRDTIATSTEVAATTKGVVRPVNWMLTDKYADLLVGGPQSVWARLGVGSVPTAGLIRLTLMLAFLTPRATL